MIAFVERSGAALDQFPASVQSESLAPVQVVSCAAAPEAARAATIAVVSNRVVAFRGCRATVERTMAELGQKKRPRIQNLSFTTSSNGLPMNPTGPPFTLTFCQTIEGGKIKCKFNRDEGYRCRQLLGRQSLKLWSLGSVRGSQRDLVQAFALHLPIGIPDVDTVHGG